MSVFVVTTSLLVGIIALVIHLRSKRSFDIYYFYETYLPKHLSVRHLHLEQIDNFLSNKLVFSDKAGFTYSIVE